MEKERILVLNKERIAIKLRRMAFEIWEKNSIEQEITLLGIETAGSILADKLTEILREISPLNISTASIKINKINPLHLEEGLTVDLNGKSVIIVDDVINSGKTIMYALQFILPFNLKKLLVAVLVDRSHKSFPVSADIVGLTISTTLQEHITVETAGKDITAVYLQ